MYTKREIKTRVVIIGLQELLKKLDISVEEIIFISKVIKKLLDSYKNI